MDDLIERLRERAADPKRRTDAPQSISISGPGGTLTTKFGDLGSMLGGGGGFSFGGGGFGFGGMVSDLRRVVAANQAGQPIDADIAGRVDAMAAGMTTDISRDLPPPADPATLDRAEHDLRFALPNDLRRIYAEVADGGFGPGGGLLPIERAVATYRELRRDPPGPRGQTWPEGLLPLRDNDPGYECLEIGTGRIVDWNPDELTERSGDRAWQRTFSEVAQSLGAWLDGWVGSRPQHEVMEERMQASMVEDARRSRAMIAAMTPEQRAAMGLPEVGWEKVVWGGIGLDDDEPGTS
jgi:hypothetical protein